MSEWILISALCETRGCRLVYRSPDEQIGLAITSSGGRKDRRRYFLWDRPASAPDYGTEVEARVALTTRNDGAQHEG